MRENAALKARRLLVEGRLVVRRIDDGAIEATVRGDSARIYRVGFDAIHNRWWCTCPAVGRCSHCAALMLVTLEPIGNGSTA